MHVYTDQNEKMHELGRTFFAQEHFMTCNFVPTVYGVEEALNKESATLAFTRFGPE